MSSQSQIMSLGEPAANEPYDSQFTQREFLDDRGGLFDSIPARGNVVVGFFILQEENKKHNISCPEDSKKVWEHVLLVSRQI